MDALFESVGAILADIFDNPIVQLLWVAFVGYMVLLWLASAFWVLQDMRRRHDDPALPYVAAAGIVVASPAVFPAALVVYRILRPGETLAESRERVLSERLEQLEADLSLACPGCRQRVEEDWLSCPACRTRLAHRCVGCGRPMGLDWTLCGWCGTEFGREVVPERLPRAVGQTWTRDRETRGLPAPVGRVLEPGA